MSPGQKAPDEGAVWRRLHACLIAMAPHYAVHPRVCGEDLSGACCPGLIEAGPPPHVRGTPSMVVPYCDITQARSSAARRAGAGARGRTRQGSAGEPWQARAGKGSMPREYTSAGPTGGRGSYCWPYHVWLEHSSG